MSCGKSKCLGIVSITLSGIFSIGLVGCGQSPPPAPTAPPPAQATTPPATAAPVDSGPKIDFKGETPGVLTFEQFTNSHGNRRRRVVVEQDVEVPGASDYVLEEGHLTIGGDTVVSGRYTFVDGVLARISLTVKGAPPQLVEALAEKHGKPRSLDEASVWSSGGTDLYVAKGDGPLYSVGFVDQSLSNEIKTRAAKIKAEKDSAKKDAAKKDL